MFVRGDDRHVAATHVFDEKLRLQSCRVGAPGKESTLRSEGIFLVMKVLKDRVGNTIFVGCPDFGSSVHVDDQFVLRYEIPRTLDDTLNERPLAAPTNLCAVALTVTAIDSMRRPVTILPAGVTGALYLSGDGIEHVRPGTFLKTAT